MTKLLPGAANVTSAYKEFQEFIIKDIQSKLSIPPDMTYRDPEALRALIGSIRPFSTERVGARQVPIDYQWGAIRWDTAINDPSFTEDYRSESTSLMRYLTSEQLRIIARLRQGGADDAQVLEVTKAMATLNTGVQPERPEAPPEPPKPVMAPAVKERRIVLK